MTGLREAIVAMLLAQSSASLLQHAAEEIQARRFASAIADLTRAASREPGSALVHLMLGQAYLAKGSAEFIAQAKAEFQQARDLDQNQVLASFYIAKIDLDLGRVRQAERELTQALDRKPGEHYLLALLGEVKRQQGDSDAALKLTTKALEAGSEAAPVYYYRALVWRDRKDDAKALADLAQILDTPLASVDAFVLAGSIHLQAGRLGEAEPLFRKAIAMEAARAEPHLRLAQVLRRMRRFDLALKELAQVEQAPQLSSPYFQKLASEAACERGLIHKDRGDAAKAKDWFRRALEIDPANEVAAQALRP